MSRRDLIKASALAGAAAWTAPLIVDSLASPAAAESVVQDRASVPCSWIYLIWTDGTNINYTGFKHGDTLSTCTASANPDSHGSPECQSCPGTGISYQLLNGDAPPGMDYVQTEGCPSVLSSSAISVQSCSGLFSLDGSGHITALGGITILGATGFTSNSFFYSCPNSDGSLDAPAGCQEQ